MVAAAWQLKNTTDATAATHFALVGGAVFGGFAALHWWFPKMTGRTMGENLARISFWTMALGTLLAFVPLFLAGGVEGRGDRRLQVLRRHRVNAYNLIASIGAFVLAIGIVMTLVNAILSRDRGAEAGHDPWGGESLEWFALSPPEPHNFDVLPDVRSARPMRDIREAIAHRTGALRGPDPRVSAGSLSRWHDGSDGSGVSRRPAAFAVLRDYATLTKPKVQSLLLFTTATTMYVAGRPLDRPRLPHLPRGRPLGRRRRRDQPRDRPRHRPHHGTHGQPPGGRRPHLARRAIAFGALLGLCSFALLALTVNPLAAALSLSGLLGYVFVYTLWLKRSTPQNIVIGGRRRGGAAAGRLGGRHRRAERHRLLPLRDRLLLDAAALLGALAADEGRVREGRRADAAGGRGARRRPAARSSSTRCFSTR